MAVQPQGEGLHPLEQQKGVEGRDDGAGVPQENGADIGDKGGGAGGVRKGYAVIAGVGLGDGGVLPRGLPVEFAGVHDDAAQGGAVAAQELGGRVDHDIGAMRNGTDEIGRAEGVVDDQGQTVPVGDGGDGVNVRDVAVGIAQRLQVNCLGVWPDCFLHLG